MSEDEEIVYDFSTELHKNKRVSDTTFARAEKRFGKTGAVDLVGITSYYTLLAMQLNTARYRMPGEIDVDREPRQVADEQVDGCAALHDETVFRRDEGQARIRSATWHR